VLVAGCHDGKIRVWDDLGSDNRTPREFKAQGDKVLSLSWQEGVGPLRLVSRHRDGVRLWDFDTGECVMFLAMAKGVRALSADLHRLVYSQDKDIKVLDLSE
jgi:WD40 repeat protein